MKRYACWSGLVILLMGAALGTGAPLDPRVGAFDDKITPYAQNDYWRKFEGGKKAVAIVVGKRAGFLGLYAFDPDGNCIAWDDDVNPNTPNDLVVEWIPPRTGLYSLEVKCLSRLDNEYLMAVRQTAGR